MKTFEVNRLVSGNRVFPTRVQISDNIITIIKPGVFSKEEEYIHFNNISWVKTNKPLLGFSSIEIGTPSRVFSIHGFTKDEVDEMKSLIN